MYQNYVSPADILQEYLVNLLEFKLEIAKTLDEMQRKVQEMERDANSEINWPYILRELVPLLRSIDLNESMWFLNDIEEEINDIPYKIMKAKQSMRTAVNPILKNTPVFFDASNPPLEYDYDKPPSLENRIE